MRNRLEKAYPEAYVMFLVHFHGDRDYFECHEQLEDYWKEHPESPYRVTWVGLIQSAVGMYHYRRGNIAGAVKSLQGALQKFHSGDLLGLGIDAEQWRRRLEETLAKLREEAPAPYRDIEIPIQDSKLLDECVRICRRLGFVWGAPSEMDNAELIHRHLRRDRTPIIEERQRRLDERRGGR